MAFQHLLIPTVLFLILCRTKHSVSEPRATEAALICSNRTAASSNRQLYIANFLATMDLVTPQVDRQGYGIVTNGTGNNTVYTFGECMKDLSQDDCNLCFAQCKTQILRCLPFQRLIKGGRLFYDGCYLRYDDYMFFNESLSAVDRTVCGTDDYVGNRTLFGESVGELVRNMRVEGMRNDGFFTGSVRRENVTVFGLAQCWEFVSWRDCERCLADGAARIESCDLRTEGRVLNSGCYLRYSLTRFYNNSESDSSGGSRGGGSRKHATIIASVCGSFAFLLLTALISISARRVILRRQREKKKLGSLLDIVSKSKSNYSYETLEKATNYFSDSNKLGEGGSGTVYKGILPNGQTVAVKRLFFITTQWVEHFFNEVNLISDIHHKNLVKLLGCSVTGPESLLVYEYVPNQSLHDYLFVRKDVPSLAWEERYKIILGTAEGLCFLHEESKVRIIHRDIKLSNVLLNRDFTPRIADFGLARLFPEDKTHISTAVAGTLGYMAPEYIVRGKLTEKADVYSFGVLVIEVVTGTRNNVFVQHSESILQTVWSLYGMGKLTEAVDPSINGNFPGEEATILLQVGLLCVQASADLRPSMSVIVKMLTGKHEISQPTQPPFLNTTAMENIRSQRRKQFSKPDSSSGNDITESIVLPR